MINKLVCNRYKIIEHLGTGGMATVWLAEDTILNRKVAIKTFKIDNNDNEAIKRFNREANAVTSLSHPNIVSIYGVENEDNFYYLILEYVDGMTLKEFMINNENISLSTVISIMKQISDGLSHAHKNGIIHRDIKPQNILLTKNLECKITDFGISRAYGDTTLTQTNQMLGTVYYLSPEQARGNVATAQSDIYSLGILMFELLTGKIPFKGESAVAIALKHLQEELPNIDKYRTNIPQSVKNIIIKATMKNPNERYLSSKELNIDLDTCLNHNRMYEKEYKGFSPLYNDINNQNTIQEEYFEDENYDEINYKYSDSVNNDNSYAKDFKETKEKKSIMSKIIISLLTFTVLFAGIFFVYSNYFDTNKVSVPDLKNVSLDVAVSKIEKAGLTLGDVTEIASDSVSKNQVISSDPSSGKKVSKGTAINLKISSGKETIEMPNYLGMTETQVKNDIEKRGFKNIIFEKSQSDEYAEGKVMKQSINVGKEIVPSDTTLTITISSGYKTIVTPNLKGKTLDEAYKIAEELGINIKVTSSEYNDEYAENKIFNQNIIENTEIKKGDVISVSVSKGKKPLLKITVPNFIGNTLSSVTSWSDKNKIKLNIIYDSTSSKKSGTILKQSSSENSQIEQDDSFTIVVAGSSSEN